MPIGGIPSTGGSGGGGGGALPTGNQIRALLAGLTGPDRLSVESLRDVPVVFLDAYRDPTADDTDKLFVYNDALQIADPQPISGTPATATFTPVADNTTINGRRYIGIHSSDPFVTVANDLYLNSHNRHWHESYIQFVTLAFWRSISNNAAVGNNQWAGFYQTEADALTSPDLANGRYIVYGFQLYRISNYVAAVAPTTVYRWIGVGAANAPSTTGGGSGVSEQRVQELIAAANHITEAQARTIIATFGYLNQTQILALITSQNFQTEAEVNALIAASISGFLTQAQIEQLITNGNFTTLSEVTTAINNAIVARETDGIVPQEITDAITTAINALPASRAVTSSKSVLYYASTATIPSPISDATFNNLAQNAANYDSTNNIFNAATVTEGGITWYRDFWAVPALTATNMALYTGHVTTLEYSDGTRLFRMGRVTAYPESNKTHIFYRTELKGTTPAIPTITTTGARPNARRLTGLNPSGWTTSRPDVADTHSLWYVLVLEGLNNNFRVLPPVVSYVGTGGEGGVSLADVHEIVDEFIEDASHHRLALLNAPTLGDDDTTGLTIDQNRETSFGLTSAGAIIKTFEDGPQANARINVIAPVGSILRLQGINATGGLLGSSLTGDVRVNGGLTFNIPDSVGEAAGFQITHVEQGTIEVASVEAYVETQAVIGNVEERIGRVQAEYFYQYAVQTTKPDSPTVSFLNGAWTASAPWVTLANVGTATGGQVLWQVRAELDINGNVHVAEPVIADGIAATGDTVIVPTTYTDEGDPVSFEESTPTPQMGVRNYLGRGNGLHNRTSYVLPYTASISHMTFHRADADGTITTQLGFERSIFNRDDDGNLVLASEQEFLLDMPTGNGGIVEFPRSAQETLANGNANPYFELYREMEAFTVIRFFWVDGAQMLISGNLDIHFAVQKTFPVPVPTGEQPVTARTFRTDTVTTTFTGEDRALERFAQNDLLANPNTIVPTTIFTSGDGDLDGVSFVNGGVRLGETGFYTFNGAGKLSDSVLATGVRIGFNLYRLRNNEITVLTNESKSQIFSSHGQEPLEFDINADNIEVESGDIFHLIFFTDNNNAILTQGILELQSQLTISRNYAPVVAAAASTGEANTGPVIPQLSGISPSQPLPHQNFRNLNAIEIPTAAGSRFTIRLNVSRDILTPSNGTGQFRLSHVTADNGHNFLVPQVDAYISPAVIGTDFSRNFDLDHDQTYVALTSSPSDGIVAGRRYFQLAVYGDETAGTIVPGLTYTLNITVIADERQSPNNWVTVLENYVLPGFGETLGISNLYDGARVIDLHNATMVSFEPSFHNTAPTIPPLLVSAETLLQRALLLQSDSQALIVNPKTIVISSNYQSRDGNFRVGLGNTIWPEAFPTSTWGLNLLASDDTPSINSIFVPVFTNVTANNAPGLLTVRYLKKD